MRTLIAFLLILILSFTPLAIAGDAGGYPLLTGAVTTGAGTSVRAVGWDVFTAIFEGTGITTGATINLEARTRFNTWVTVHTQVLNSSTNAQVVQFLGPFEDIRANVTSRTDGSYNVSLFTLANK